MRKRLTRALQILQHLLRVLGSVHVRKCLHDFSLAVDEIADPFCVLSVGVVARPIGEADRAVRIAK